MAKDPAFLFYSTDFFMGTIELSDEQTGQYIRLMCLQHQKGHLSEAAMRSVMHGGLDPLIMDKFKQDKNGMYYNERLENEITKRRRYAKTRAENRKSGKDIPDTDVMQEEDTPIISETKAEDMTDICSSHDEHMVNEIVNVSEDIGLAVEESPTPRARENRREKGFSSGDKAYQAAVYLDRQIRERLPEKKPASEKRLQAWAADFDKCQRLDGQSWEDIAQVLRFSQADPFWQANILSAGKFREKYVQLLAKMRQGRPEARGQPGSALDNLRLLHEEFAREEGLL